MTYVYSLEQSQIKREPTKEELKIVEKQEILVRNLYKNYMSKIEDGTSKVIGRDLTKRLWNRYLKEYKIYNELFEKYLGYCY